MAISILDTDQEDNGSVAQDATLSLTALDTTGADCLAVVLTKYRGTTGIQSHDYTGEPLTWNGDPLSIAVETVYNSTNRYRSVTIYYLANPDQGSYTLTYTHDADPATTIYVSMIAYALSGVDTSDPIGMTEELGASTDDAAIDLTTESAGSLILAGVRAGGTAVPVLTESSLTEDQYYRNGTTYQSANAAGHKVCTTATTYSDVGWTLDLSTYTCFAAAEIQEATGSPPAGSRARRRLLRQGTRPGLRAGT